jgi:hypothetical protein
MPSDDNSLTIGADGPILLHDDHYLITDPASETQRESRFERDALPLTHQAVGIVVAAAGAEPSLRHTPAFQAECRFRLFSVHPPSLEHPQPKCQLRSRSGEWRSSRRVFTVRI